jgi:polysaccharide biosynthesis transport protein
MALEARGEPEVTKGGEVAVPEPGRVPVPARPAHDAWPLPATPPRPPALSAGPDAVSLLQALRRRWVLAVGAGLACAAAAASAAWVLMPPAKYTAHAMLRVASNHPNLVFNTHGDGTAYATYQRTQIILMKSRSVLTAALRDPKIAARPTVKEQYDPAEWLEKELAIDFPSGSEVLQVGLSGERPEDIAALVNAVVDSYLKNVVDRENLGRHDRFDNLTKVFNKYQADLEAKRKELRTLAESVGTDDKQTLALQQQLGLEQVARTKAELQDLRSKKREAEIELALLEARNQPAAPGVGGGGGRDLGAEVEADQGVRDLKGAIDDLYKKLEQVRRLAVKGNDPTSAAIWREIGATQKSLNERRQRVRQELARRPAGGGGGGGSLQDEIAQIRQKIATYKRFETMVDGQLRDMTRSLAKFNTEALDLQNQQDEIAITTETAKKVGSLREAIEVEFQAPPRITLWDKAEVPRTKDTSKRIKIVGAAGFGSFAFILLGVSFWEYRARRINSADEVVHGLGLRLMGTLPAIPSRPRRAALPGRPERERGWDEVLVESINAIRTILLHASRTEALQVVMVTSAQKGEGKTSLSVHLAASLARAGYKTLLIDGDLRSPAAHRLFDMAVEPGLAEYLRGDVAGDLARPTPIDGLWLIPAGASDPRAMQALALEAVGDLFARARADYDFVIVDTAPVLPVADTLLLSRHVDAVVFSILRDVSRIPKVYAAYERLKVLGVRLLGAVVTGTQPVDGQYYN